MTKPTPATIRQLDNGARTAGRRSWRLGNVGHVLWTDQGEPEELPYFDRSLRPMIVDRVRRIYHTHRETLKATADIFGMPSWGMALLVALIAYESKGDAEAGAFEAKLGDWSFGLGMMLTRTAWNLCRGWWPMWGDVPAGLRDGGLCPDAPIGHPASPLARANLNGGLWMEFLFRPYVAISLIGRYLAIKAKRHEWCPVQLYATYNAGGLYVADDDANPWGLVHVVPALDGVVRYHNEAISEGIGL